jgi:hypothetical protein
MTQEEWDALLPLCAKNEISDRRSLIPLLADRKSVAYARALDGRPWEDDIGAPDLGDPALLSGSELPERLKYSFERLPDALKPWVAHRYRHLEPIYTQKDPPHALDR